MKKAKATSSTAALAAGLAAVLALVLIAVVPRLLQTGGEAPAIGGPFALVDQSGHNVSDATYRGKLMLIYFGYTFCPDVCPTTLGAVTQAFDRLSPAERAQVVPIFITVDPERDTVDQMAQYVANFSPALVGLTGTPEQIKPVLQEYRVYARKAEGSGKSYTMDHSSILYLMDRNGKYLAHFEGSTPADQITAGIKKYLAG